MSDDEGGLHDGRKLDVAVSFMLPLELIQQSLVGRLRETEKKKREQIDTKDCVFLYLVNLISNSG